MIDAYILMDIITDHNLCKTQKETLQSVIDKIEQGTLIDTGAFYIDNGEKYGSEFPFVVCKDYKEVQIFDFCFTREDAEKRIKELQNEHEL